MMYLKNLSIIAVVTLVMMGCTPVHKVQYQSDPPGAVVYCQGKRIGFAPQVVSYNLTAEEERRGILEVKNCTAKWMSGAIREKKNIRFELSDSYDSFSIYLFSRPEFPNSKEDEAFAMEREKIRAMEDIARTNRSSHSSFDHHNDDYYPHHHQRRKDRETARMHTPSTNVNSKDINRAVSRGLGLLK